MDLNIYSSWFKLFFFRFQRIKLLLAFPSLTSSSVPSSKWANCRITSTWRAMCKLLFWRMASHPIILRQTIKIRLHHFLYLCQWRVVFVRGNQLFCFEQSTTIESNQTCQRAANETKQHPETNPPCFSSDARQRRFEEKNCKFLVQLDLFYLGEK